jgi:hypothetical protein
MIQEILCYCEASLLAASSSGHGFQLKTVVNVMLGKIEGRSCSRRVSNGQLCFPIKGGIVAAMILHQQRAEKFSTCITGLGM